MRELNLLESTLSEVMKLKKELGQIKALLKSLLTEELNLNEAAQFLGVSTSYMYKLNQDELPFHKRTNKKFFMKQDLIKFKNHLELRSNTRLEVIHKSVNQ